MPYNLKALSYLPNTVGYILVSSSLNISLNKYPEKKRKGKSVHSRKMIQLEPRYADH